MARSSTTMKPGETLNPNGRPKKEWTWSGTLKEIAERVDAKSGKDFKTAVGEVLFKKALEGDVSAIKELGNRWEGMPTQKSEITGEGGQPLMLRIIRESIKLEEEDEGDSPTDPELPSAG